MTVPIGNYFVDSGQPPLSAEEKEVVRRFHHLYYLRWLECAADTINLSWYGHHILKCPLDLWVYQELLVATRPDVVIETGTKFGGSALFLATIFDLIGHGRVITIDTDPGEDRPQHPRIEYLLGSSIDSDVIANVARSVGDDRAMVILDSNHYSAHVYSEMVAYSPLVHVGDYLIVEDTNVCDVPTAREYGDGPMKAVFKFLSKTDEFVVDERCERFLMTLNPQGYLRRKS